jgi:purine-binding chemotaxis protein CheW
MEIQGGKFLTFLLGGEVYGIPIKKVKEILGRVEITRLTRTEGSIVGAGNFRGQSVPIVDLRRKFGLEAVDSTGYTCIIIETNGFENQIFIGITVDTVSEVAGIAMKDIEPPPEYEAKSEGDFLAGLGKLKNKLILILDCDKILSPTEIAFINQEWR